MSLTVYRKQLKTGGGATALDGIDGAILLNLAECTVYESGVAYTYVLNATSGAADDGLNTIAPDTNPGTKRWILNKSYTLMTDDEAVAMSSKAPKASPVFTTEITTPKVKLSTGQITSTAATSCNNSTPTDIALGGGFLVVIRDIINGGTAVVLYENTLTPVIVSQPTGGASTFVTGSPGANEIQIANRSGSVGITAKGGSGRATFTLRVLILELS